MSTVVKPAAMSIPDACSYSGLGRTTLYKFIGEGRIDTRKAGRKRIVLTASVDQLLASLPREAA